MSSDSGVASDSYVDRASVDTLTSGMSWVPLYARITDAHINEVLGWNGLGGLKSIQQIFDIQNRDEYACNYDGERKFVLDRPAIYRVDSVISEPDSTDPEYLVEDSDYWVDLDTGVVTIDDDFDLVKGQRTLRFDYRWGWVGGQYPVIVSTYASLYCASLREMMKSTAKNDDGLPLKEIEIGRYRELYDTANTSIKSKYDSMLRDMKKELEKYKLWE